MTTALWMMTTLIQLDILCVSPSMHDQTSCGLILDKEAPRASWMHHTHDDVLSHIGKGAITQRCAAVHTRLPPSLPEIRHASHHLCVRPPPSAHHAHDDRLLPSIHSRSSEAGPVRTDAKVQHASAMLTAMWSCPPPPLDDDNTLSVGFSHVSPPCTIK